MPKITVDRLRMQEVIVNLIENAIKYSCKSKIPEINIGVMHEQEKPVFFVRDNGIGVDKKYHDKIFGLFEQLDPMTGGTGVGLALVKRIVEFHGGEIWVESEGIGKGSTFYFTLPMQKAGSK